MNFRPAHLRPCASAAVVLGLLFVAPAAFADGEFEIVKATADKVWRLNKRTGEISICTLEGTQLVCAPAQEKSVGRTVFVHRVWAHHGARNLRRPIIDTKPVHGLKAKKWK